MAIDFPVSIQDHPTIGGEPVRSLRSDLIQALWPMALSLLILVLVNTLAIWVGNGGRGYVTGESVWSKARREATDHLRTYVESGDPVDYDEFVSQLSIPLNDRRARLALQQQPADETSARMALLSAENHEADIPPMIWLFKYTQFHPNIQGAIDVWSRGDEGIQTLRDIADEARAIYTGQGDRLRLTELKTRLNDVSHQIGQLEHEFLGQIGDATRDMARWHLLANLMVASLLLGTGAIITRRVLRQRRLAEAAAKRSSERLELATTGASDGIWDWHVGKRQLYWTARVPELLGYANDEAFHRYQVLEQIHPADQQNARTSFRTHLVGLSERLQLDVRMRCHDGGYRWFRIRGMALRDSQNNPLRVLGTLSDIHASMLAQQALRSAWTQSQYIAGELELALNGADVALWAYEPQTGRILHHKRWDALLGRETMPPTFDGWLDITHPEDRHLRLRLLQDHLDSQTNYYESEFRMLHADGHWVWVRSRGRATARDAQGRALKYSGAVMNISAQVEAREVQKREQDFLRTMIQGVDLGVMIAGFDRVVFANRSLARMLECDHEDELENEALARLMPATERADDLVNRHKAAQGGVIPMRVVRLVTRSQRRIKVVMNLSCVDWNGEPHFISTVAPLAGHAQLEEHLRTAADRFERALLSELEAQQAAIARELHDSLGSMLAGVSLLLGGARAATREPAALTLLERTQDEVREAAEMTRAMARGIMPVGTHPGAFLQALEQYAADMDEIKGVRCVLQARGDFDDIDPSVGNHVFRIVQEASTNAIRHGNATALNILLDEAGPYYRLEMEDNGTGCDMNVLAAQGEGVGIRSMRSRARALGASLALEPVAAGGVRVLLQWPASGRTHWPDDSDSTTL